MVLAGHSSFMHVVDVLGKGAGLFFLVCGVINLGFATRANAPLKQCVAKGVIGFVERPPQVTCRSNREGAGMQQGNRKAPIVSHSGTRLGEPYKHIKASKTIYDLLSSFNESAGDSLCQSTTECFNISILL